MNSNLKKKLKVYSGVAVAMLALDKADGQIVHVDVNPDDTLQASFGSNFFTYDLDNDGLNDFSFQTDHFFMTAGLSTFFRSVILYGAGNNSLNKFFIAGPDTCGNGPLQALHNGFMFNKYDTIPKTINIANQYLQFEKWQSVTYSGGSTNLLCFSTGGNLNYERYFGFEFQSSGQLHYGWMRVEFLYHKVVIKDYAYIVLPNSPLFAGDTVNYLQSVNDPENNLSIIQHNSNIILSLSHNVINATVKVFDLLGKEILTKNFSGNQTEINIDRKGIFIVEVSSEINVMRKKIYVY